MLAGAVTGAKASEEEVSNVMAAAGTMGTRGVCPGCLEVARVTRFIVPLDDILRGRGSVVGWGSADGDDSVGGFSTIFSAVLAACAGRFDSGCLEFARVVRLVVSSGAIPGGCRGLVISGWGTSLGLLD